jgi:hypothetical protein
MKRKEFLSLNAGSRKFEVEPMESVMTNHSSAPFDALANSYPLQLKSMPSRLMKDDIERANSQNG